MMLGRASLTISRNRRRTRFRCTAPPTRRDVTIPTRAPFSPCPFSTPRSMNFPCTDRPSFFTRANSAARNSRTAFGKRRRGFRSLEPSAASRVSGLSVLRPGCAARSALQRPSAGAACGPAGGDEPKSHGHSWFSYVRGNRTGACGCAWMLDRCVLAWSQSDWKKVAQNSGRRRPVNRPVQLFRAAMVKGSRAGRRRSPSGSGR
jgi:hypothetical protein